MLYGPRFAFLGAACYDLTRHLRLRVGDEMDLKKKVIDQGVKWMSDPRFVKVVSNPALMSAVMKGFELRGKAVSAFEEMVKSVVHSLDLASREELNELKETIRNLQAEIKNLQSQVAAKDGESPTSAKKNPKAS